jgi:hypothetical protein
MSDYSGSYDSDEDEEADNMPVPEASSSTITTGPEPRDYADQYASLSEDVVGEEDGGDAFDDFDKEKAKKKSGLFGQDQEGEAERSSMLFDFRRGAKHWPDGVELVDGARAEELIEKARAEADKAAAEKDKDKVREWRDDICVVFVSFRARGFFHNAFIPKEVGGRRLHLNATLTPRSRLRASAPALHPRADRLLACCPRGAGGSCKPNQTKPCRTATTTIC